MARELGLARASQRLAIPIDQQHVRAQRQKMRARRQADAAGCPVTTAI
jgi:hypothetical protein